MKIKHLLIGMLAVAAAVACEQNELAEEPKLDVDKEAVSLAAAAGEASFNVTSNQSWVATPDADWVSLEPASGEASEEAVKVTVTADDNPAEEARTAKITVKAGELTKTVEVTQAAKDAVVVPEPGETKTYILVGDAVGGWDVNANGVVLTLADGYYVAKGVDVVAQKGMHFTLNDKWEGNVKGLHGLIAPNEIGEVGNNNISLTEGGKFDVYLTEALDKFYFMSEGKLPSEAVEHVDIAVSWGVCGAYAANDWGNAGLDAEMTLEGEWYVAKGIEFTEVNFKVRGNNSWADDVKWGRAAEDQICELNKAIAVSTCTEYKAANSGASDNPNIYVGGKGTYDVYFSPDKKEVWVMNPGLKPGDEAPEVEKTYTLAGTIVGTDTDKKANYWKEGGEAGLMTLEGDYYVLKNVNLDYDYRFSDDGTGADFVKFKIVETGTWNGYGLAEHSVYKPNTEIPVVPVSNGGDIYLAMSGVYDVYFDKANGKVWVMEPGYKPGEEPAKLDGQQWMAEVDGMQCLFDFGVSEEGMLSIAVPSMDESAFVLYMMGLYEVEASDKSSGVVLFTQYDWEWDELMDESEFPYSNLTATSVGLVCEAVFGVTDPVTLTLVEEYIPIEVEGIGGGDPEGAIPNGVYWFIEPTNGKVMTPLGETQNYGRPASADVIGVASTAKNAFTFTYDSEWTGYTIQDSYGRYLYCDMKDATTPYNTVSVSASLPDFYYPVDSESYGDVAPKENYAYFIWQVYPNDDGTYEVASTTTYFSFGYSEQYNNWELRDAWEDGFSNLLPSLIPADYPVEEPEPTPEPEPGDGNYSYTFAQNDLGANGSPSSEVTLGGVAWKFSMTDSGSKYLGWDTNYGKGIQIGKSKDPATEVVLSTEGISGKITSIKVNTAGASGTDAVLNVTVGGNTFGSQASLAMESADYLFEGSASGEIVLKWTCTAKAIYVKSIEIVYE